MAGWPLQMGDIQAQVAVGDIDSDGYLELVAADARGNVAAFTWKAEELWERHVASLVSQVSHFFIFVDKAVIEAVKTVKKAVKTVRKYLLWYHRLPQAGSVQSVLPHSSTYLPKQQTMMTVCKYHLMLISHGGGHSQTGPTHLHAGSTACYNCCGASVFPFMHQFALLICLPTVCIFAS